MSADRYEISEGELDVLAITGPEGTRYIDGEEIEARAIRQLQQDLAAVTAERDTYRDEFSDLCRALSVGSEGRPGMTAEDWRRRVDEGIDFLTRPLIAEISKRSKMLDICTQNCSDWIGKWRAEQERAEQAETRLAAIYGRQEVMIPEDYFRLLACHSDLIAEQRFKLARADAEIAELRRLLGDAREVIADEYSVLAIDPRGREQELFVIAHLLEQIGLMLVGQPCDAARGGE